MMFQPDFWYLPKPHQKTQHWPPQFPCYIHHRVTNLWKGTHSMPNQPWRLWWPDQVFHLYWDLGWEGRKWTQPGSIAVSKGSLNRWAWWYIITYKRQGQKVVYKWYSPCQWGDYMVPIPPIKGTRKLHWPVDSPGWLGEKWVFHSMVVPPKWSFLLHGCWGFPHHFFETPKKGKWHHPTQFFRGIINKPWNFRIPEKSNKPFWAIYDKTSLPLNGKAMLARNPYYSPPGLGVTSGRDSSKKKSATATKPLGWHSIVCT